MLGTGAGRRVRRAVVRGRARTAAIALVLPLALTACQAASGTTKSGNGTSSVSDSKPVVAPAKVAVTPADGASGVAIDAPVTVAATGGKIVSVSLAPAAGGASVAGQTATDGSTWQSSGKLELSTKYKLTVTAANTAGAQSTQQSTFSTLSPEHRQTLDTNVANGGVYGIAMPISIVFDRAVPSSAKAAVEKALTVTSQPAQQGSWGWVNDGYHDVNTRLDYRPKAYWAPGTHVALHAAFTGLKFGQGTYATHDYDLSFTISGRDQYSVADTRTHKLTVYRGGSVLRTLPMTSGQPGLDTWSGTFAVLDKQPSVHMNSETVGLGNAYDLKDVKNAVHLTLSGTYVHDAPWSVAQQGVVNVSHGCIGLSDDNSAWFYQNTIVGDPVQVTNSPRQVHMGNGYTDFTLSWSAWQQLSALA